MIFIHVFNETPPAPIFSRVADKITSLSLIYLSHLQYAFYPYSAHVSSIDFSQVMSPVKPPLSISHKDTHL